MNRGSFIHIFMIAMGGAMGAVLRVYVSQWLNRLFPLVMPMGILMTNLIGCFLTGVMVSLCDRYDVSLTLKFFIISGGLGAFTTFSTFSFEMMQLVSSGHIIVSITYVLSSVVGGLLLFWLGTFIF